MIKDSEKAQVRAAYFVRRMIGGHEEKNYFPFEIYLFLFSRRKYNQKLQL